MLNRLNEYFNDLKNQLQSMLPQSGQIRGGSDVCCISITSSAILLIHGRVHQQQLELVRCIDQVYENKSRIKSALFDLVKTHGLRGFECYWVLQPEDYQIVLTDRLPVQPHEFQAAIRWKIKNLLTIPIDDTVIDSFAVPPDQFTTIQEKIMVVAARLSYLQSIRKELDASGLRLTKIDIPELALKNISTHYEHDNESVIFIYAHERNIQVIITHQKQFYFSRYLGYGLLVGDSEDINKKMIERLVNELNRSFDYYQSHWHNKPPSRAIFAATVKLPPQWIQELKQQMSIEVSLVNITDFLKSDVSLSLEQQAMYLPLIGCLMGKMEKT